jgi:biopolymer transport protein ExbB
MSASKSSGGGFKSVFAAVVIPAAFVIAYLVYAVVLGNGANFAEGNPENHPLNYLGIIHKGGVIVPIIMALLILVITFSIERFMTINSSKGSGSVDAFIGKIRAAMAKNDLNAAVAECDRQKGSIANVVKAGISMYKEMEADKELDKERKILAIQKELEEATTLELPMMSKNLVIISTIASIATLMGLLGTVIGMIRAFAALAQAGAPDAVALSTGISEALINTALGIGTSAIAIVMYNFFTNKIDALTYGIDEAGYSVVQTFSTHHKA